MRRTAGALCKQEPEPAMAEASEAGPSTSAPAAPLDEDDDEDQNNDRRNDVLTTPPPDVFITFDPQEGPCWEAQLQRICIINSKSGHQASLSYTFTAAWLLQVTSCALSRSLIPIQHIVAQPSAMPVAYGYVPRRSTA